MMVARELEKILSYVLDDLVAFLTLIVFLANFEIVCLTMVGHTWTCSHRLLLTLMVFKASLE